jgi:5-methylcytosine-specific restriction enzyme subunit McrC
MSRDYRVSNIYYMLAYAFDNKNLVEKENNNINVEEFENVYNLLSVILCILLNRLIKRGISKEYVEVINETLLIKGKINITQTIKNRAKGKTNVICEYDEFSSNSYLNSIIKTTVFYLIKSSKVDKETKKALKKLYSFLQDIDLLDLKTIEWKKIKLNKNNKYYKFIINICYMIQKGMILTEEDGNVDFKDFTDQQSLNVLFEKFVREYFRRHFPELNAKSEQMSWKIDDNYMIDFIPKMVTDITLRYKNKILIIDTKFYGKIVNDKGFKGFDTRKINRDNWNQINAYVANEAYKNDKIVSGMLLYARTDEEISPDVETSVMGNKISIKTLDMRNKFSKIARQLDGIANKFKE